jgi:predicted acyltransferase
MRGLGVLIMLQGHVFDAWVRPEDRSGGWFWLSQFLGGLPAPIFLFLAGVSLAIVLDRMRDRGASSCELALRVLRRGCWILFLAYLFRVEQFLMWYPFSQARDILKVDTLNCIAVCTVIVGLLSIAFRVRRINAAAMAIATTVFVFLTPLIYPLKGLPEFFLAYLNGNDHPWYFSVVPWAAFALAGITFGYVLLEVKPRLGEPEFFKRVAVAGITFYAVGAAMSLTDIFEYGFFDYSLTSPHFFFVRLGWVLLILYGAYVWSARERAKRWSPLITLGQASLIVYWVHIDLVYGRAFHGFGQSLQLSNAAMQLLWLIPLMLVLASFRQIRSLLSENRRLRRLQPAA